MTYFLDDINAQAKNDPKGFIELSEQAYHARVESTVELLAQQQKQRPIILINGPSSSGKTTTAGLIGKAFAARGIHAEIISMDDYYRTRGSYDMPQCENGTCDLESPLCMDLPLLSRQLQQLAAGEEICVPRFDFQKQARTEEIECMRLDADEVAVIEGIHALNGVLMGALEDKANGLYLSVASEVALSDTELLRPEMLRFLRRAVRDRNFRGEPVPSTIRQWRSVRRGEGLYIAPYRHNAAHEIDTYLPYESCILFGELQAELAQSEQALDAAGLSDVYAALGRFSTIDYAPYLPENSVLHEFIG